MAIDNQKKRQSIINLGTPVHTDLPTADGDIDAGDRAALLNLYNGGASPPPSGGGGAGTGGGVTGAYRAFVHRYRFHLLLPLFKKRG